LIASRSAASDPDDVVDLTPRQQNQNNAAATAHFVGKLAILLIGARHFCQFDLLSYLGISQGRWEAVSWIIKALSERPIERPLEGVLLDNGPLGMRSAKLKPSEDLATRVSFELPARSSGTLKGRENWGDKGQGVARELQMAGLGQVWRSLGNFVLLASSSKDTDVSQHIMDQTLGALAILHHNGVMPKDAYVFGYPSPTYPFLIDRLSPVMMMAILDAEWNLNQSDSPDAAKYLSIAQFAISGVEFPDLHNPEKILPYAHSIWLELILWSCLKGRWITDGMDILHRVIQQHHGQNWSIVPSQPEPSRLIRVSDTSLSAELVTAYSRSILNTLPSHPEAAKRFDSSTVIEYLTDLKAFMRQQSLVFDEGISTRVVAMEDCLSPATSASTVLNALALSRRRSDASLGLHHQLLRSSLEVGSSDMVGRIVRELRVVLDRCPSQQAVPPSTLANLLEFLCHVDSDAYGHEILYGQDETDVSLLPDKLESVPGVLPALLRYATATSDVDLSREIALAFSKSRPGNNVKTQMMFAVAESQIEHRQWDNLEQLITKPPPVVRGADWSQGVCTLIASLSRACLILQRESLDGGAASPLERAATLLRLAALANTPRLQLDSLQQVHTTLGMLASVGDGGWAALCRPLLRLHGRQPLQVAPRDFALVLGGVATALPLREVRAFWERWCVPPPDDDTQERLHVHGVAPAPAERTVDVRVAGGGGGEVLTYVGGVVPDWRAARVLHRCVEERQAAEDEDGRALLGLVRGIYGDEAGMLREAGHAGPEGGSREAPSSGGPAEDDGAGGG
jgi:hypothetical protein